MTVLVPVEPEGDPSGCLKALKRLRWPRTRLELLVARGRQPSRQRNLAASKAKGEWILFLDSDSRPSPGLAQRLLATATRLKASACGGPNLPTPEEPFLGRAISGVLESRFGSMAVRARYAPVGQPRLSGEKELILCNLLMRADRFRALGGFREDLYPNEENEFLNRLSAAGDLLAYDPGGAVERPRRRSFRAYAKQGFNYGRGRMRQMLANPFPGDLVHLAPVFSLLYCLGLPWLTRASPWALAAPAAYLACDLGFSAGVAVRRGAGAGAMALGLFPIRHFGYALGMLAGLVSAGPARGGGAVKVERIRL